MTSSSTTTVETFTDSVEEGLKLSKRLYYGKDRSITPPKQPQPISKSPSLYLPSSPLLYAIITDPSVVDNPDIPSYQPYVYGRCDPPALMPLSMNCVELIVDSYFNSTVFVTLIAEWRVNCVMGSKSVDCRFALPMGEQVRLWRRRGNDVRRCEDTAEESDLGWFLMQRYLEDQLRLVVAVYDCGLEHGNEDDGENEDNREALLV